MQNLWAVYPMVVMFAISATLMAKVVSDWWRHR